MPLRYTRFRLPTGLRFVPRYFDAWFISQISCVVGNGLRAARRATRSRALMMGRLSIFRRVCPDIILLDQNLVQPELWKAVFGLLTIKLCEAGTRITIRFARGHRCAGKACTVLREYIHCCCDLAAGKVVKLEGIFPYADIFRPRYITPVTMDGLGFPRLLLELSRVILVVEDEKRDRLLMVQIVHKPEDRPKTVILLRTSGHTDSAKHDDLDPILARMGSKIVLKNLPHRDLFALPFHNERKLWLGINSETVDNELEIAARILTDCQFRHVGNDRPGDFVRVR